MLCKKILLNSFLAVSIFNCSAKSETVILHPILNALDIAANEYSKVADPWRTCNSFQEQLINRYWPIKHEIDSFSAEELKNMASKDVEKVNAFLKNNGFDIQLTPNDNPAENHFYIASILKILCKWMKTGLETKITVNSVNYPAVKMQTDEMLKCGTRPFSILKSKNYDQPIIVVETQNGTSPVADKIYITKANQRLKNFELLDHINKISKDTNCITQDFDGIIFPMVDLNVKTDMSWLLDLSKGYFRIAQALQQTKFQMNEEGAAAQSAVAIDIVETCVAIDEKPSLIIDEPFYLWVKRPNTTIPIFAAYIDIEDWKKPEKLG